MKTAFFNMILVALMLGVISASAQERERENTDYTNNRKVDADRRGKGNTSRKTPVKIIQYIPGSWNVEQVLRDKEDITGTDTLARNQVYEFTREGKFKSYTGTEMIDSGSYRVNENTARLYLNSDIEGGEREYNVWFDRQGTMTLQPTQRNPHASQFRYVYRRTGAPSRQ